MTQPALPTACPDCGGAMREIILFGRGPQNPLSGAACDTAVVHYTDAKATRSAWLEMFDVEGEVRSMLCRKCNRLFLYGLPNANSDSVELEETIACLTCGTPIDASGSICPRCGWSYNELPVKD